jgi:probable phosphoglycerate mutase
MAARMSDQESEARLVLVRHGETEWNREGRIQGYRADSPLSAIGIAQAEAVAARLGREGVDLIFASDLGRARQTAEPVGRACGVEVIHEEGLRERSYGLFEGCTFTEIAGKYPEAYERMRARDPHFAAPEGGESAVQFHERIVSTMERIAAQSRGKRAAVITHQGVVGVLYRYANGLPHNERRRPRLVNAACNHFRFVDGRWILDQWCDISHLPPDCLEEE